MVQGRPDVDGWALFLVELRATGSATGDLRQMHRALQYAVSRQAATGAAIRWAGEVFVPSDGRCLCLVEADAESKVCNARDTAGLHAAPVLQVHVPSDPHLPASPTHHAGER